jgi:hypothetical protein
MARARAPLPPLGQARPSPPPHACPGNTRRHLPPRLLARAPAPSHPTVRAARCTTASSRPGQSRSAHHARGQVRARQDGAHRWRGPEQRHPGVQRRHPIPRRLPVLPAKSTKRRGMSKSSALSPLQPEESESDWAPSSAASLADQPDADATSHNQWGQEEGTRRR